NSAHQDVKHGNEDQIEEGCGDHSAEYCGAYRASADAARSLREDEWKDAENESKRRHQDGTQADKRGFHGGVEDAEAFFAKLFGEFDDEDRVFAGEADQHYEADLAVDVIFLPAQRLSADSA